MRKQYHFRRSEQGLLAWDVHRLIELTRSIAPRRVAISEIREMEEPYWFDAEGSQPTCRNVMEHMRLAMDADLSYPIILAPDGGVMDGMHRVARAFLQGDSRILAVQLLEMPEPDYIGVDPADLPYVDT